MELNMKTDQRSHVTYMVKYGSLVLYDDGLKNRYIIDNENIQYLKNEGTSLIGITD